MTVLHFTLPHQPNLGGLYVSQNAFRKVSGGKIVEIVSTRDTNKTEGDYKLQFWGLEFLDKRYGIPFGLSFPININQFFSELRSLDVSLIIIHSLFHYHAVIGYLFAKKYNIPYIFVPHGTLDPYVFSSNSLKKRLWLKLVGQSLIENASSVVVSTLKEKEKASEILKNVQVDVCSWGVEIPDLSETQSWRLEMRHKLGIDSETKILLFLGRINKMKRPLETALAFQALKPKGWKFIVVGYPENKELLSKINSKCDPNYITCYPPVEGQDKWKLLAASDAFVNLSYRENFGRSAIEAAALGLPTLISDGVDLYPDLEIASAAKIVHFNKNESLIDGLSEFLNLTPHELRKIGNNGRDLVFSKFTIESFENKLSEIINRYSVF